MHRRTAVCSGVTVSLALSCGPAERAPAPPSPATTQSPPEVAPAPAPVVAYSTTPEPEPAADFENKVAPLLANRCAPCHIPGGTMYPRLPFDDPDVVLAHTASILRRLDDLDDKRTLQEWVATQEPSHP